MGKGSQRNKGATRRRIRSFWSVPLTEQSVSDDAELATRARRVKNRVIADALDAGGNPLTVHSILSYISVLLQMPTIMLLYQERADSKKLQYLPYFSIDDALASRDANIMSFANGKFATTSTEVIKSEISRESCLNIFGSGVWVRVFLLYITGLNVSDFYELSPSNFSKLIPKDKKNFDENFKRQKYAMELLQKCLKFDSNDRQAYGDDFLKETSLRISNAFSMLRNSTEGALEHNGLIEKEASIKDIERIGEYASQRLKDMKGEKHGIDRIYTRASLAAKQLNQLDHIDGYKNILGKENFPNMFFLFRTFDRITKRGADGGFGGFSHNVSLVIPHKQRKEIIIFLKTLSKYECGKNYKEEDGRELYANLWKFDNSELKEFALYLDSLFWKTLSTDDENFSSILGILDSKIGDSAISFADAVFTHGTPQYRMPFRREGGLHRIRSAISIWQSLSGGRSSCDTYEKARHFLSTNQERDRLQDCMRVVVFFYITRMIGPAIHQEDKVWTKITGYPIEVHGAVVGTIGMVSYQDKNINQSDAFIPTPRWNQEFLFFTEIVASAQRAIRQQFRDYQISELVKTLKIGLKSALEKADSGKVYMRVVKEEIIFPLNETSKIISRFCPYPMYTFSPTQIGSYHLTTIASDAKHININGFCIKSEQYKGVGYFGGKTSVGFDEVLKENEQSLITKANAAIKDTMENVMFRRNISREIEESQKWAI